MKNFRHAFTMLELIFVIVVIGILASVALVKLSATRDDAMIEAGINNVKQAVTDIDAYYTAKDKFGSFKKMTNVNLIIKNKRRSFYQVEKQNCIRFQFLKQKKFPGVMTVKIVRRGSRRSKVCKAISDELARQGIAAKGKGVKYEFGGSLIN